jgi:hypothetical protein
MVEEESIQTSGIESVYVCVSINYWCVHILHFVPNVLYKGTKKQKRIRKSQRKTNELIIGCIQPLLH